MKALRLFFVLMLSGSWLSAAPPKEKDPRTLTVQGQGKASAIPDIAVIGVEVSQEGPELDPVLTKVRRDMQRVMETLKGQGIAEKDLRTESFQVHPKFQHDGKGNTKRVGYVVTNRASAKVRDLAKTGRMLSAVLAAGASSVSGPDFELDNPQVVEREALAAATRDAQAKAKTVAEAAGVTLGAILQINPQSVSWPGPRPPRPMMARAMMAEASAPPEEPIAAGEQTLTGFVSLTYEIQ